MAERTRFTVLPLLCVLCLTISAAVVEGFVGLCPVLRHDKTLVVGTRPLGVATAPSVAAGALGLRRKAAAPVWCGLATGIGGGATNSAWAVLVGADGTRSSPTRLLCPPGCPVLDVDAVKDAAKAKFADDLKGVSAAKLVVCEGEEGEALRAGQAVADLKGGRDEDNPLLIYAPKPAVRTAWVQLESLDKARSAPAVVEAPIQRRVFDIDGVKAGVKERFGRGDILTGVGLAQLEVFDGDDTAEALEADILVADVQCGEHKEKPLVVKAPIFLKPVQLTVWIGTAEDGFVDTLETFASEKEFMDFVRDHDLQHKKMDDGNIVQLSSIRSLSQAVAASKMPDTQLFRGYSLKAQVKIHQGTLDNHASGIEQQTTRAIVSDESLQNAYGKMSLVNEGESVSFKEIGKNNEYLQCDGLVKNTETVLLNEAKSAPEDEHIQSLMTPEHGKVDKLKNVLKNPEKYASRPAGAIKELQGLEHVEPVLSGFFFKQDILQRARNAGIVCVRTDGKGYFSASQ